MCVQPASWPEPDPVVAAAIAAKYAGKRPRPLAVQIRDRLGQWLADEQFAAAFGVRGRPGWSPSRLALVTVLQRAENLADRPAAEAVRLRTGWQYLLGLGQDDPGFDHTVLPEFRARVADAGLEQVALDALLERLAADGRWPHLGREYLYPLLRADPQLALEAGSAALTTLVAPDDVDITMLEAIEACFPEDRRINLDLGIAAVATRLAEHRLTTTTDPAQRAYINDQLAVRLTNADQRWPARPGPERGPPSRANLSAPGRGRPRLSAQLRRLADQPRPAAGGGGATRRSSPAFAGSDRLAAGAGRAQSRHLSF
jgi:hypothetical protein